MLSFSELINELKGLKATGSVGYRDSIRGVRMPKAKKPQGRPTGAQPVRPMPSKADTSPAPKPGKVTSKPLGKSVPYGSPETSGAERPAYGTSDDKKTKYQGATTIPYKRRPTPSRPTNLPVTPKTTKPQATTTTPKTTKPQTTTTTPKGSSTGKDLRDPTFHQKLEKIKKRLDQKKNQQGYGTGKPIPLYPNAKAKAEAEAAHKASKVKRKDSGPGYDHGRDPEGRYADDNLKYSYTKQERETGGEIRPKRRLPRPAPRPASMPRDNTQQKVSPVKVSPVKPQQQVKPIGPSRDKTQARNIRNNNPMNIRHSSDAWQGASKNQTDKAFVQFDTAEHGMRAALRTMRTYQKKHGLTSLSGMMNRWAPKGDGNNDPNAYAAHVAKHMGVKPDHQVDLKDRKQMRKMMKGMISMEGGKHSYTDAQLDKAYDMAFPKRAIKSSFFMNFADFVAEDDMKGMSVSSGHKRSVKQGAGMTKKGVEAYKRKNPGSKLGTAVTTPPSKLKAGSKAAGRRKSFCARSRSWRGPRGLAARRRWNC